MPGWTTAMARLWQESERLIGVHFSELLFAKLPQRLRARCSAAVRSRLKPLQQLATCLVCALVEAASAAVLAV